MTSLNWLYSPRPPQLVHCVLSLLWVWVCEHCYGAGHYAETVAGTEDDFIPDYNERYCNCEAGRWRRFADGWSDADIAEWYEELLRDLGGES